MSAPTPLRLRPLEVGDLLDETFRIYRRHFLLFAGISVILAIPSAGLQGYGFFTFFNYIVSSASAGQTPDFNNLLQSLVVLGIGLVVSLLLAPFAYGAVIYAACESALGHPVTVVGALRAVLRRYFAILGYVLLIGLMGIVLCLLPLWIWIWVGWVAVLPVMFVENAGLGAAMGRSWRLVEGRWWRTFLILMLVVILWYFARIALEAFIGLANYKELLSDPVTLQSLARTAVFVAAACGAIQDRRQTQLLRPRRLQARLPWGSARWCLRWPG